jgi:alanine dehydrogenase
MTPAAPPSAAPATRLLTRSDVARLVDMAAVMDAVEGALRAHARGETQMPVKVYLAFPEAEGDLRAMPASVGGAAGVKWINSHACNAARHGRPTVRGILLLSDPETADLLAVMDATLITALRTGASAGIATGALARPDARSIGLVGCGVQARYLLEAVQTARPQIDRVCVHDRDEAAARAFAAECGGEAVSLAQAAACDVLCTATPSRTPFLRREWLRPGVHVNAMGADAHGKQECETAVLAAARVFVDDMAQAGGSGEVNVPLATGALTPEDIAGTLGEVLEGGLVGRMDPDEITLFDSTGLAIQDVAVASLVHARACEAHAGTLLDFFA